MKKNKHTVPAYIGCPETNCHQATEMYGLALMQVRTGKITKQVFNKYIKWLQKQVLEAVPEQHRKDYHDEV